MVIVKQSLLLIFCANKPARAGKYILVDVRQRSGPKQRRHCYPSNHLLQKTGSFDRIGHGHDAQTFVAEVLGIGAGEKVRGVRLFFSSGRQMGAEFFVGEHSDGGPRNFDLSTGRRDENLVRVEGQLIPIHVFNTGRQHSPSIERCLRSIPNPTMSLPAR